MKLRRLFRAALVLLALAAVGIVLLAAWLYTTEGGARFVLARAVAAAGDGIEIDGVAGSFRDELILSGIRYRDARVEAGIDRVSLRLGVRSLLARMLVIEDLESSTVRMTLFEPVVESPGAGPAELPLTIRFDRATVEGIRVERGDSVYELERIALSGVVESRAAYLSRLELRAFDFFLSAQGGVGWIDGFSVDGLLSWSGAAGGRQWLGSIDVEGVWPEFNIEQELLEPYAETARGRLSFGAVPSGDLTIDWAGLGEFSVSGEFDIAARQARARIEAESITPRALVPRWPGTLGLSGDVELGLADGLRIASPNLELEAALDDERLAVDFAGAFAAPGRLTVDRLVATSDANRIELAGTVETGATLDLDVLATLDDIAALSALLAREEFAALGIARFVPTELAGRATADLRVAGDFAAPLIAGSAALTDSRFAGLPLELAIEFATPASAAAAMAVERFDLALGGSRLSARGNLREIRLDGTDGPDAAIDVVLDVAVDELAELGRVLTDAETRRLLGRAIAWPAVAGRAETRLSVGGRLQRPELSGQLALTDIVYEGLGPATATLDGEVALFAGGVANLGIQAAYDVYTLAAVARGTLGPSAWEGRVESLALDEPWLGEWTLVEPAALTLGPGRIDLPRACLGHAGSDLCAEWSRAAGDERIALSADDFDLGVLAPLLPDEVAITGRVELDASLDRLTTRPAGSLVARAGNVGIEVRISETESFATTLETIAVDATLADPALELSAAIEGLAGGRAALRLAAADIRNRDAPMDGRIDIDWPDLTALALLSPDIGEVHGALSLGIDLAGTAADPLVAGSAGLTNGSIVVPAWGVAIDRIGASATSPDGESLEFSGLGYLEDRPVALEGVTVLDPARNFPTRLRISGENLPVAQRPDATVFASPDLDVTIDLPRVSVSGRVLIPEADIAVEQLPVQAVRASPDAVVHGPRLEQAVRPIDMRADLTIELGDRVRYNGGNLTTELTGSLRLEYRSGFTPVASGNVTIGGSYDAYGQTLTLERGELLFAGSLSNPALDVLAIRRIGSTTVGLRLSGTLLAPNPQLYSEPVMSDANALSYLMFGRPLSSSDDEDTATLESTALALGLQQALPAFQRVGESLGLDELTIAPNEIDAGALMAGKYLSPKVYMSYTYGLFNRLGGFLLRYDINERFSLETRSGNEKSMDLLYSIEKD